ncbi:hypothetical protein [Marinobacter sp.]|uniref:SLOG domain-containing protein n=1 Tax=Marinobacter sp. TaxID=50741 RepID=UPI003A8D686C
MTGPVFLSASIPDPRRSPEYAKTADTVAITSAVSALVHVLLGRRHLVWGGHPAITPMIWAVAEDLGINYGDWVTLYQSNFFAEEFPEENEKFKNVIYVDSVDNSRDKSLVRMREEMLAHDRFQTGIFIGGMEGIVDEFELFRSMQPQANAIPIFSTGGAVLDLTNRSDRNANSDLWDEMDYVKLFNNLLEISASENREPSREPGVTTATHIKS